MNKKTKLLLMSACVLTMAVLGGACKDKKQECEHEFGEQAVRVIQAASCEEKGIELLECEKCGETTEREIAATGHTYDEGEVTMAATCTETGTLTYTCEACGKTKTETLDKVSHTIVRIDAVEPTCTTDGATAYAYCEICGEFETEKESIPAFNHTVVVEDAVMPTCTEKGKTKKEYCSVCDEVLTASVEIPALGHREGEDESVAATCTDEGKTAGSHCLDCNTVLVEQQSIPVLPHTEAVIKGASPTCTEEGASDVRYCLECRQVLDTQEVLLALGHTVVEDEEVEATCTAVGQTAGCHCSTCDEVLVAQQEVPMVRHNFEDGNTCKGCDMPMPTGKLTFMADGVKVSEIAYDYDTTFISVPEVPTKAGYNGVWERYTLDYTERTVNAVYTAIVYTIRYVNPNYKESSINYEVFGEDSDTKTAGAKGAVYPTEYTVEDEITLTKMKSYITCACGGGATYTFSGWYLDKEMTQVFSGTIPAGTTGDIVIYCDVEMTATHFY